jgi:transposase
MNQDPATSKSSSQGLPEPEVVPQAKRRTFSVAYKLRILEEVDSCTVRGEIGGILRREGLYSSHLTDWRRQRDRGELQAGQPRRRGPKPNPETAEMAQLRRENTRLKRQLQQAEKIIEVQKKLAEALELSLHEPEQDENS